MVHGSWLMAQGSPAEARGPPRGGGGGGGWMTTGSETTEPRDSETIDPTRKLRPSTRKLPSPSDSETTDQRLGNYPSTTRNLKTCLPRLGHYHCQATRKLRSRDSGTTYPDLETKTSRLEIYGRDSESMIATRKLQPRLGNYTSDKETKPQG